ncbi:MAG: Pyruvate dehydrogenase E1 component beta subunit, partial [uncultured Gemmatimonadaceae bacterium]
ARNHLPRRAQPGAARRDAARRPRLPHGRGGRALPGRLQGVEGAGAGVRRHAGARHADHGAGVRRRRRGRGDGGAAPDHRVHDVELRPARARPGGERGGEDALHVGRPVQHPDGLPRPQRRRAAALRPAQPGVGGVARAHPGAQGRGARHAGRRQGAAQGGDPRRQPGGVPGGRDALQHQGRGARRRVRHPARSGGAQARGRALLDHHVRQDGARRRAGGRPAREGGDPRRRRGPADAPPDGRRRDPRHGAQDQPRRGARGGVGGRGDRRAGGGLRAARLLRRPRRAGPARAPGRHPDAVREGHGAFGQARRGEGDRRGEEGHVPRGAL